MHDALEPLDLDTIEAELATLDARINAAMHRRPELIRVVDSCGLWAQQGAKSCAHWLSWRLGELPQVDEELRHARVTYCQARAITPSGPLGGPVKPDRFLEGRL